MPEKIKHPSKQSSRGPSEVNIRMYNVGFGDCFLLTWRYASGDKHMLVDFGSTAGPKGVPKDYMTRIAKDIRDQTGGKLHILIATHRHRDHISGFSTEGGKESTGSIIAGLHPDVVIQPWTEDPDAQTDAVKAIATSLTKGQADTKTLQAHFVGALDDMHKTAGSVLRLATSGALAAGTTTLRQLAFLGEDNLPNLSAVQNLIQMGKNARALYVNAGMKLNGLLPGVAITVLGPPDLTQTETIRKMRSRDADEFWQFRRFWAEQARAGIISTESQKKLFPGNKTVPDEHHAPNVRWFVREARKVKVDQLLELVRDLDTVMNNTSVILLMEFGGRKLLFPGDAQIENWAFALNQKKWVELLKDVNLYKVGHHGSLNATPKTLWKLFERKGGANKRDR
jgi:hypothetical protein